MVAIASVLVLVFLSLLITRFATLSLQVTGLSKESARFQARSALTGAGFTTSESERVVDHPVRRRVIMRLMLLGSVGLISVISSLVLSFRHGSRSDQLLRLAVLVAGLALLWWISRLEWVDRQLSRLIAAFLRSRGLDARDYARLLNLGGDYGVTEMAVGADDWVAGRELRELRLRDEGIVVLGVRRKGSYIGVPGPSTCIAAGDTLVLYGRAHRVCELDQRRRDASGDQAHGEARADQTQLAESEADDADDAGQRERPPDAGVEA